MQLPNVAQALAVSALLAACSAGASSSSAGSATSARRPAAPGLTLGPAIGPAEPVGWLAVAPVRRAEDDAAAWLPLDDSAALLLLPDGAVAPAVGQVVRAVPALGEPVSLTVGERRTVRYGCDGNSLDAIELTSAESAALPPGPVWVLPDTATAKTWRPRGIEVAVTQLEPSQRTWSAGPLRVALTVKDESRANLAISIGPSWLLQSELTRPAMAGAEQGPLDLTQDVPGMPTLSAAFELVPSGPVMLVLATPGFEGTTLMTVVYDGFQLSEVAAMGRYLYACAF
jgi:hypothetical protein